MRRRARFLRKARELAYRDLGGLVFNLHRFGQRNDELVLAKLNLIGQMDTELRTLEAALGERRQITVLREAGITACPRCAAIQSSEDRFCPNCGLSMGRHPDLPIAGSASAAAPPAPGPPEAVVRPPEPQAPPGAPAAIPLGSATAIGPPADAGAPPSTQGAPPSTKGAPPAAGPPPEAPARAGTGRSPTPPTFDATEAIPRTPPAEAPAEPPRAEPAPARARGAGQGEGEDTRILRPPAQGS
jgi:hypothetical protein